ncbi:FAD/NAD(P)-binding protein [Gracilibacillus salitolerans]|uniref:FAD/NAD(P)-binding protein n=1 Tax=Gracilibacillus salitolerans TaxID=2663022 RepID=UPI001890B637|nr:FAD/NAD(P)-binding protein [Gracilibacillus salitolerans]
MYKWIIIGGGIHGCTIAVHLLKSGKVEPNELLIVDRYEKPLHKWSMITSKIGMDFLRSPSVHHIDQDPFSLQNYAKDMGGINSFLGRYKRPRLDFFNDHCYELLDSISIQNMWYQAEVHDIRSFNGNWRIYTNQHNFFETNYVVLALGVNEQPAFPDWALPLREKEPDKVKHIFEEEAEVKQEVGDVCIIGGGISAAHLATKLCAITNGKVTLVKRHPFRIHDFDSDPGWLGPKRLAKYNKVSNFTKRRSIINKARLRGSIPRNMFLKLKKCQADHRLEVIDDEVKTASYYDGEIRLSFAKYDSRKFSCIWLATGSQARIPEKQLMDKLIVNENLPCASCGFPIVNKQLEWKKGLYVSGALAELEVGPVAHNISGARKAAVKLAGLA